MATRELYEVLGLQPFADGAMVDQAYWHLAKSFQTLAVTDPRARQALDELNEAYGVLGTPRLREEYDVSMRLSDRQYHRTTRSKRPKTVQGTKRFGLSRFLRRLATKDDLPVSPEENLTVITAAATSAALVVNAPRLSRRAGSDVQQLQASTEDMLKRWRANAGIELAAAAASAERPDTTLVDIFRSEQAVEEGQEPLSAVMDVLRRDGAPVR